MFQTLVVILATILFAWIFFWFCERPYIKTSRGKEAKEQKAIPETVFAAPLPSFVDEG